MCTIHTYSTTHTHTHTAERGHDDACLLLMSQGSPVDIKTTDGVTAFMSAAKNSKLSTMVSQGYSTNMHTYIHT